MSDIPKRHLESEFSAIAIALSPNVTDFKLVGFGFAQPTLRYIKGFGDLIMQIFSAIPLSQEFHQMFSATPDPLVEAESRDG